MNIIFRFIASRFIGNMLTVLFAVSGIIFATSFMQQVANAPNMIAALDASFAHFLEIFPMFLPLALFLGTLITFYKLLVSSELVIIQSAGMSAFIIMLPMIITAFVIGLITITILNPLSADYIAKELGDLRIERIDDSIWVKDLESGITIRAENIRNITDDGLDFVNAMLIRENTSRQITERIDAPVITLSDGRIAAQRASVLETDGITKVQDFSYRTSLSPINIVRRYLKPNQVSFWELPSLIRALKGMGVSTNAHLMQFLSLLLLPFVLVSMTVLGAAFSQTKQRRIISMSRQFGVGIITCFIVYFMIQIMNAIAVSGSMHPVLATVLPPAIVLFFATAVITRIDNI